MRGIARDWGTALRWETVREATIVRVWEIAPAGVTGPISEIDSGVETVRTLATDPAMAGDRISATDRGVGIDRVWGTVPVTEICRASAIAPVRDVRVQATSATSSGWTDRCDRATLTVPRRFPGCRDWGPETAIGQDSETDPETMIVPDRDQDFVRAIVTVQEMGIDRDS